MDIEGIHGITKLVTKGVKSRVGELSEVTNHLELDVLSPDLPYANCVTSAINLWPSFLM